MITREQLIRAVALVLAANNTSLSTSLTINIAKEYANFIEQGG